VVFWKKNKSQTGSEILLIFQKRSYKSKFIDNIDHLPGENGKRIGGKMDIVLDKGKETLH